jgi:hypothetical protein
MIAFVTKNKGMEMDTTEERNGTYFYHGHSELSAQELFWLIFTEKFSSYTGLEVETAATIIAGWPLIPKRKRIGGSTGGTSIASKTARRILKGKRYPTPVETPVGLYGKSRFTTSVGGAIARYVPYVGYAQATIIMMIVGRQTRVTYNTIASPKDQIQWTSF